MTSVPLPVLLVKGNYMRAGGPETLLASTMAHLDRGRFDPTLVILSKSGGLDAVLFGQEAFGVHRRIPWHGLAAAPLAARSLSSLVPKNQRVLIDTHDLRSNLAVFLLRRVRRIPWIARVHGWLGFTHSGRGRLYERIERVLVRYADLVVVGCEAARQEVEDAGIRRVKVVRQGIEIPETVSAATVRRIRHDLGATNGSIVAGVSGRVHPGKGQATLIRALARLKNKGLDVRGLVVGEGPSLGDLRALCRDLGVSEVVTFAGFQRELIPYVAAMDIFVSPSLKDGLSLAVLEAMALGRPVIASAVGGLPEAVNHGTTGLLVPPADVPALADALESLVVNPDLRERLARAARVAAVEEFSAEPMVRAIERTYAEVVAST